jgi:ribosome maturation factor RimP
VLNPAELADRFRPLLGVEGFELFEVKVHAGRGRPQIVVVLDHRTHPITISELQTWSRRFEELLDMAEDVPRSYALDVTSPGLDNPLIHSWQFARNIGRELIVETAGGDEAEERERFTAVLTEMDGTALVFDNGRRIELDGIKKAQVKLPW